MSILTKYEQDCYHNRLCDMSWAQLAEEGRKLLRILADAKDEFLSHGIKCIDQLQAYEKLAILDALTIAKIQIEDASPKEELTNEQRCHSYG